MQQYFFRQSRRMIPFRVLSNHQLKCTSIGADFIFLMVQGYKLFFCFCMSKVSREIGRHLQHRYIRIYKFIIKFENTVKAFIISTEIWSKVIVWLAGGRRRVFRFVVSLFFSFFSFSRAVSFHRRKLLLLLNQNPEASNHR
jgi:hypothetical protein